MSSPQSYKVSITIGLFVTLLVMSRILEAILDWQSQNFTTFLSIFSDPEYTIIVIYFTVLMFSIWLIRGPNNKSMYLFWCLGYIMHYYLYWAGLEFFLLEEGNKNIYVLNWLPAVCVIPLLLLCRYRTYYSIVLIAFMIKFNIWKNWAKHYFEHLNTTDFETKLRRGASLWFVVEFSYAAFQTVTALRIDLGPKDSLWKAMHSHGLYDPYPIYIWTLNLITVYFTILIFVNAIRDFNKPDQRTILSLPDSERRDLIKRYKPSKFDPF